MLSKMIASKYRFVHMIIAPYGFCL